MSIIYISGESMRPIEPRRKKNLKTLCNSTKVVILHKTNALERVERPRHRSV